VSVEFVTIVNYPLLAERLGGIQYHTSARKRIATTDDTFHLGLEPPAWHQDAACRYMPKALFFSKDHKDITAALEVCAGCAVKEACKASRNKHKDSDGTWGGKSYEKARQQRKSPPPKPIAHGEHRGYKLHLARGERPCEACHLAYDAYLASRRVARRVTA